MDRAPRSRTADLRDRPPARPALLRILLGAAVTALAVLGGGPAGSPPATAAHSPARRAQTWMARRAQTWMVRAYLTTADLHSALQRQPDLAFAPVRPPQASRLAQAAHPNRSDRLPALPIIRVDPRVTYQQIDGFGGGMTDSSAWLLYSGLNPALRDRVMRDLFSPTQGIGLAFLRLPIGASDFTRDGAFYSYDDLHTSGGDPTLAGFSIQHDMAYIVPLLREALTLNPHLRIVATPWSPPGWMKANGVLNNLSNAGWLLPSSDAPLAQYFVKFIQAYAAQGIPIYAITPQNEPGAAGSYPGMNLPAGEEARLVRDYLGPALAHAGLRTRILADDMEWSSDGTNLAYPLAVMGDPGANRYLAGTAYHCYRGNPQGLTLMHDAYPGKDIYETECSDGACLTCPWTSPAAPAELVIAAMRNWSRDVALWNIALDPQGGPPRNTGCVTCIAPVTVDPARGTAAYTGDYYGLGQASRFVRPGARRIASTTPVASYHSGSGYGVRSIDDVAFRNPDGATVLLVYNAAPTDQRFQVRWRDRAFGYTLPAAAAATFTWSTASR